MASSPKRTPLLAFFVLISLTALVGGCHNFIYDPPPQVELLRPERGSFVATEPVRLTFTEGIEPESFTLQIWEPILDKEGLIPQDATPIVEQCNIGATCAENVVLTPILDEADEVTAIDVSFGKMGLARPGSTLLFEVPPGLSDERGNTTGQSLFYNVQFRAPEGRFNADPVEFQEGTYIFSAIITDPVPAVLTLISDVIVMPDGRFFAAGGEGDEINGAPKETTNPVDLIVDDTDQGWAAHIAGFVTNTPDGDRLLETDPIDLYQPTDPLFVYLNQVRLDGKIIKDDEGHDYFTGSLSFEGVDLRIGSLEATPTSFEGGSQSLVGIFVKPSERPENHPLVCGDQCGAIVGECKPPADFPDEDVCAKEEE